MKTLADFSPGIVQSHGTPPVSLLYETFIRDYVTVAPPVGGIGKITRTPWSVEKERKDEGERVARIEITWARRERE